MLNITDTPNWVVMIIAVFTIVISATVGWTSTQDRLDFQEKGSLEIEGKLAILEKEFVLYKIKQGQAERDYKHLSTLLTDLTESVRETNKLNRELIFGRFQKEK